MPAIVMKPWSEIRPYERNPRRNDEAVDKVANSIRAFGFQQPIVVDRDMVIIAGHTRWKAAARLKLKEVPVIIADNLTEEQANAYRIADNSAGEVATWDFDLLAEEISLCPSFDFGDFGLNIEAPGTEEEVIVEDIEEVPVPQIPEDKPTVSKIGSIWKCGEHYVMCGDAENEKDIEKLINCLGGGGD